LLSQKRETYIYLEEKMEEEKRHEEETADIMVPENSTYQEVKHVMEREPISSDNLRQLFDQFFNDNRNEDVRNSSMQLITSLWSTGNEGKSQ